MQAVVGDANRNTIKPAAASCRNVLLIKAKACALSTSQASYRTASVGLGKRRVDLCLTYRLYKYSISGLAHLTLSG